MFTKYHQFLINTKSDYGSSVLKGMQNDVKAHSDYKKCCPDNMISNQRYKRFSR